MLFWLVFAIVVMMVALVLTARENLRHERRQVSEQRIRQLLREQQAREWWSVR